MTRYSSQLLAYLCNPVHAGVLPPQADVISASVGNRQEGRVLEVYLRHHQRGIVSACFQASGAPALIAGGELLCQLLENKPLTTLRTITPTFFLQQLELSSFYQHVALLLHKALQQLIDQL